MLDSMQAGRKSGQLADTQMAQTLNRSGLTGVELQQLVLSEQGHFARESLVEVQQVLQKLKK